ncbi:MAG: ABC transporter ATP-binding protein [Lachnospiraceae bacterium]
MLEIKKGVFGYKGKKTDKVVLDDISCELHAGELLCILGANGAGKTTMYRTILGFIPLLSGEILLDGKKIETFPKTELARKIAYVPQYHTPPFPYTVFDVVVMGRGAHISRFSMPGKKDEMIAEEMLERMGISYLKDEIYTELSGGERQLVLIARALAQQASCILMDEPASNLDFGNQIRLLQEIRKLASEGIGICFTSHYPDHAFLTEASVLALEGKKEWKKGPAKEIITAELLKNIYGLDACVQTYKGKNDKILHRILVDIDEETKRINPKNGEK